MADIDVGNHQAVGGQGDYIIVAFPKRVMTKTEALVHAAWLVALADDNAEFPAILEAVRGT